MNWDGQITYGYNGVQLGVLLTYRDRYYFKKYEKVTNPDLTIAFADGPLELGKGWLIEPDYYVDFKPFPRHQGGRSVNVNWLDGHVGPAGDDKLFGNSYYYWLNNKSYHWCYPDDPNW